MGYLRSAYSFLPFAHSLERNMGNDKTPTSGSRSVLDSNPQIYEYLIESNIDGLLAFDRDCRYTLWNPIMERISGIPRDRVVGRIAFEVFPFLSEIGEDRYFFDALAGKTVFSPEQLIQVPHNGIDGYFEGRYSPLYDGEGEIVGGFSVVRDVTARLKSEQQRLKARKHDALILLAGGIAHDFNNLLTSIFGNLDLLQDSLDGEELTLLKEADAACSRAQALTRQLLNFSRSDTPNRRSTSLPDLLNHCAKVSLSSYNAHCSLSFPEDLWPARVDSPLISRVFENLFINAAQAMPDGGKIEVSAQNVDLKARHGSLEPGTYVRVDIQDFGGGIPPELVERVFDPYFTTKVDGNGLGLASSLTIVKNHGGELSVDSQHGEGTCFHVYLLAKPPQATTDDAK